MAGRGPSQHQPPEGGDGAGGDPERLEACAWTPTSSLSRLNAQDLGDRRDVYAGAEQITIAHARDVTLSVKSSKTLIYAECASAHGGRTATGMRWPVAASMPERQ